MDLAWTNSLDQLWRSPMVPMWLTLAAAAFFALVFLVIVLRADRSVANGALTVMTLLAVAVAAAATVRGLGTAEEAASVRPPAVVAVLPALACIDDLAGDSVESACERILFGSPDHVAAAVSYAAARLGRLTALGDAGKVTTPEVQALRRAVERDRYGLVAHVLVARDGCTAAVCAAYQSLTDRRQIAANIEGQVYKGHVARYAPSWSSASSVGGAMSAVPAAAVDAGLAAVAGEPAATPTGKPTNAEFPSAASIPPVSIMTSEPPTSSTPPATPPAAAPQPRPAAAPKAAAPAAGHAAAAAKRRTNAAPKAAAPPPPPVQIAPPPPGSR